MSGEKKREREKSVLTKASYACNCQHWWCTCTQAVWTKKLVQLMLCLMVDFDLRGVEPRTLILIAFSHYSSRMAVMSVRLNH